MENFKNNITFSDKQYQYKLIDASQNDLDIVNNLNDLGKEGYKVSNVTFPNSSRIKYILEKETSRPKVTEDMKQYYNGFKGGMESFKRGLWHSPYEEPQTPLFCKCIVELEGDCYDGRVFKVFDYHKGIGFSTLNGWMKLDKVLRWAYIKDILPSEN